MLFINEEQLRKEIIKNLTVASMSAMQETKNKLQSNIDEVVYSKPEGSVYDRTHEFYEAWDTDEGGADGVAAAQMYYEPDFITTVVAPTHASVVTGNSVTEVLADWIFLGHEPGCFPYGNWWGSRDAWKKTDKDITNTVFRSMYENGLNKTSMPWKRSTGAVIKTKD